MNTRKYTWEDIKAAEAEALKKGEFQGTVMQALQDLRNDVKDLQVQSANKNLIQWGVSLLVGGIAGIFGSQIKP